jgi:1-acyl-sn-glycerol-3-phosphate acyltransferase
MAIGRIVLRTLILFWTIAQALLDFLRIYLQTPGDVSARQRAEWLHRWCKKGLPRLRIAISREGVPPAKGLLVSNHLSYLDILVFSALSPCVFVSKHEVAGWPVFGWMSHLAGTVFVDRSRRAHTPVAQEGMEQRLAAGLLVVLFPEATSSNGSAVLPFRSALFESAIAAGVPISAAHISYESSSGNPETDVCYWGEMTLAPHVLRLFSIERVTARVRFSERAHHFSNRKQAARDMYDQVLQLAGDYRLARAV